MILALGLCVVALRSKYALWYHVAPVAASLRKLAILLLEPALLSRLDCSATRADLVLDGSFPPLDLLFLDSIRSSTGELHPGLGYQ